MRSLRRPASVLAALALTASLAGCSLFDQKATEPASTSMVMPEARAVGVDAKTGNGRILIVQNPSVGEAIVSAEAKLVNVDRAERFSIETTLGDDGTLVVRPLWPDGKRQGNEKCSFEITVPTLHGVVANSSNGSITIKGGSGSVELKTSNGAITIEDRGGDVRARTSNGRIQVARASGAFDLETSNGAVSIISGSPALGAPYDWRVSSSNGSIRVDLDKPLDARLRASTSNGKARVERISGGDGSSTLVSGKSIEVDGSRGNITIDTSNGSITIRTP